MCDICKRGLLPTAWKQFGHNSMLWKLKKNNESKYTSKLAVSWNRNNEVDEIHWPSMSPDLVPMESTCQLLKIYLRRKKIECYQSSVSVIKHEWESLSPELIIKLVHSMNNRISEVIESHGEFLLRQ